MLIWHSECFNKQLHAVKLMRENASKGMTQILKLENIWHLFYTFLNGCGWF